MTIKDKVTKASMTLEQYEEKKKARMHRFLIISFAIFAVITTLSFLFFTNYNNNEYCSTNYFNLLNVVIISMGGIGLGYCFLILKDFNTTIDDSLIPHYKQILLDEDQNDNNDTLSYENNNIDSRKNNNTLSLF